MQQKYHIVALLSQSRTLKKLVYNFFYIAFTFYYNYNKLVYSLKVLKYALKLLNVSFVTFVVLISE